MTLANLLHMLANWSLENCHVGKMTILREIWREWCIKYLLIKHSMINAPMLFIYNLNALLSLVLFWVKNSESMDTVQFKAVCCSRLKSIEVLKVYISKTFTFLPWTITSDQKWRKYLWPLILDHSICHRGITIYHKMYEGRNWLPWSLYSC